MGNRRGQDLLPHGSLISLAGGLEFRRKRALNASCLLLPLQKTDLCFSWSVPVRESTSTSHRHFLVCCFCLLFLQLHDKKNAPKPPKKVVLEELHHDSP